MTDRDRWGLRGRVQTCRLQRVWYSRRCGAELCETEERGDATLVEFRPDGSLARRWHHNPDGSEWTSIYGYDGSSRLVTLRSENAAGPVESQRYEYDDAGRLIRIVAQAADGSDRVTESYEYDASGRQKKTFHVDLTVQRSDTMYSWGVEGTDSGYSAPGAATLTILHNMRDQPTELLFSDRGGRTLSRVEFVYDEMGRLVEEAQTMVTEALPPEVVAGLSSAQLEALRALFGAGTARRVHGYDAQGHRIETHTSMFGALGGDSKTMTYNDHGDQIEEIWKHEQRDYNIDDEGRLSDSPSRERVSRTEARFHYNYDARGNWIKKVVEARAGTDVEFSVSSIEDRILVYYD
jgi:YD repeat-containing protein